MPPIDPMASSHSRARFWLSSLDFPASIPNGELLLSHVSINFDRAGFQRDLNVVYPIDRLRELVAEGVIGGVAETHFSVMGSTDPAGMMATADQIAGQLRQERIDSVLLSPV